MGEVMGMVSLLERCVVLTVVVAGDDAEKGLEGVWRAGGGKMLVVGWESTG